MNKLASQMKRCDWDDLDEDIMQEIYGPLEEVWSKARDRRMAILFHASRAEIL